MILTPTLDILKEMYGRKEVIIAEHIRQLSSLKKVERDNDAAGLRQLYLHARTNMNTLNNQGVPPERIGILLCDKLINSIPPEMQK